MRMVLRITWTNGNHRKEEVEKEKENKRINLVKKKHFRQEEKLGRLLYEIFPDNIISTHDRRTLKGLELDFLVRDLRLAFEYDGEQHFNQKLCEEIFKSDFKELQKRDKTKDKLCVRKKIILIRVKFDEPLTKSHILKKIKEKYGSPSSRRG